MATALTQTVSNTAFEYRPSNKIQTTGAYVLPASCTNSGENNRLDAQQRIFQEQYEGRLTFKPLPSSARTVLDVGTGSGIWAVEMARANPRVQVYGVDLSIPTIAESSDLPSNVHFVVGNAEQSFASWAGVDGVPARFDFINARLLSMGIKNWSEVLKRFSRHLAPGGILELTNVLFQFATEWEWTSPAYHFARSNPFDEAWGYAKLGAICSGLDIEGNYDAQPRIQAAGLQLIDRTSYGFHVGSPANGTDKEKRLGEMTYQNALQIQPMILPELISRARGMTEAKKKELVDGAMNSLRTEDLTDLFVPHYVWIAQKPT